MDFIKRLRNTFEGVLPKTEKEREWWIKFRSPPDILKDHPSFLYCEIVFYILAFLTFIHAIQNGGRYKWLWFATIAHGLTVESRSYILPDIDNFWHAQSMVMLLGQRLPLHVVFIYPVFIYTSAVAVSCMNLRWWAEPFAAGLSAVLMDVPFDIMGIKLLWWTWHDDDPNIYDRHYWVPWTSYYFHASFAASFTFLFFGIRRLFRRSGSKFQSCGFFGELIILITTGLFSMPLGIMQFIPVYHPLHDLLDIHSEVCVLMFLGIYALIVWSADRYPMEYARYKGGSVFSLIFIEVLLHYTFYAYLVLTEKPEKNRSYGLHQAVGPCDETQRVLTPFGHVLQKHKYLCIDNFNEDYFNLKCMDKAPPPKTEWYTVCGTPFQNHKEYIIVVCTFCLIGLFWFWQLLCRSGPQPRVKAQKTGKQHRD